MQAKLLGRGRESMSVKLINIRLNINDDDCLYMCDKIAMFIYSELFVYIWTVTSYNGIYYVYIT